MSTPPAPARVYGILARSAPVCVLFKRGPTKQALCIHWDTETDTFTVGQGFKGRLYEQRCGLSPDGKLMIYFAADRSGNPSEWTAISRPPYLTAIAFWPELGSYFGGGFFAPDGHLILNAHWLEEPDIRANGPLPMPIRLLGVGPTENYVSHYRMLSEGWEDEQHFITEPIHKARPPEEIIQQMLYGDFQQGRRLTQDDLDWLHEIDPDALWDVTEGYGTIQPGIMRRESGGWALRRKSVLKGWEFRVTYRAEGVDLSGAGWAEIDQQGRLIFARDGIVCAADKGGVRELFDTNQLKFKAVPPPDWALEWP